jgi:NADPH2:quinone reductase
VRALELTAFDGPNGLRPTDAPEPRADADGIVVDVRAIGINYPDLLMTQGSYQVKPPLPFVPGSEIAGIVSDAPEGSGWKAGDRVAAFVWTGGYAERVYVPLNAVFPLPDDMDFRTGAATIINYHTVHFALARRGALRSGESLLVLGAGGGIGSAAVQVGKGLGAHVIGGVANDAQLDAAREAGADEVLVLSEGFSARVRELTGGRGADVVLDPLGDWLFGEAIRALAPEGRILVVGFAAGAIPELKVNRLLLKNVSAVGVAWGAFLDIDKELMVRASRSIAEMYAAGVLRPLIGGDVDFAGIPDALHRLSRGEIRGKAVVLLADDAPR